MSTRYPRPCTRRCALLGGARTAAAVALSPLLLDCRSADGSTPEGGPAAGPDAGERVQIPAEVGGIRLPDSEPAVAAVQLASEASPPELFNHVMRTYVFGSLLMKARGVALDDELAFLAATLHDLGLVERFTSADKQFELDGADSASAFLREQEVPEERVEVVWDAIAMHTTGWLAARKRPEIAMVSQGAFADVAGLGLNSLDPGAIDEVLAAFPRLAFKQSVIDTMVEQCRRKPDVVMLSQFAESGRRHIPGFEPPILEDLVLAAPFDS